MPGRWMCVGIIGFWLAMVGWFAGREIWVRYGQRPRLHDALRLAVADGRVHWLLKHNYQRVGDAWTEVVHNPDTGSYRLLQDVNLDRYPVPSLLHALLGKTITLKMTSRADVTPEGQLQQLSMRIEVPEYGRLEFEGRPSATALQARIRARLGDADLPAQETEIPYNARDLFLTSLCPASRMPGLRPGRRWETPVVDPSETLAQGLLPTNKMLPRRPVVVEVMPDLVMYRTHLCYEVRSEQADASMRIWVRQSDHAVLKQEVRWGTGAQQTLFEVERQPGKPAESAKIKSGD